MVLGNVKQSLVGTCHSVDSNHLSLCLLGLSDRFNRRYDLALLRFHLRGICALLHPNLADSQPWWIIRKS